MLLLLACAPADQAFLVGTTALEVQTDRVDFGAVAYLSRAEEGLEVHNIGAEGTTVEVLVVGEGFGSAESSFWLGNAERRELTVWYEPIGLERQEGELLLSLGQEQLVVELVASTNADADGDGHTAEALGGRDCDDTNEAVHPDAIERWYDGLDQDCQGDSDFDADQDGHDREPEGDDCDDQDVEVRPGGEETWYDGVDSDCSGGSDFDADGDSFDAEPWGEDCDDTDPTRVVGC